MLIWAPDSSGRPLVLLIRRAGWSHHGGTWGPPGGARDSHESPAEAAVREAAEECGAAPGAVRISGLLNDDHGGWSYQTLIAEAAEPFTARPSHEAAEAAWVPADDVASLALHPGFGAAWPVIRKALAPVTLIVDGANVMGSRPDGWWRDRAGAMTRLHDELAALAAGGVARLPDSGDAAALDRWYPRFVLVVEGKSRAMLDRVRGDGAVRVVAAPAEGDDTIADLAAAARAAVRRHRGSGTAAALRGSGRGRHRAALADGPAGVTCPPAAPARRCDRRLLASERRSGRLAK